VSSLWTPGGARDEPGDAGPDRPAPPGSRPPGGGDPGRSASATTGATTGATAGEAPDEAAARAELARLQSELRATPVGDIIANHAIGLWQLAVLHLGLEDRAAMNLGEASLAIDALAALVDGLGARLGRHEGPLRDALTQLRLAYVQQTNSREDPS
jgi:hypothetical protein